MRLFLIPALLVGLTACGPSPRDKYLTEYFKGADIIRSCKSGSVLLYNSKKDEYLVANYGNGWGGQFTGSVSKSMGQNPEKFCE